jgi:RNA polymerase sigma factor (sigma-70 family)
MTRPLQGALQFLRTLTIGQAPPASEDGELLRRFIQLDDQDAFAELLRRHGPMVLGVCSRLLDDADAEDAFQATFLVLARRASAVRKHSSLGSWLHGVAVRLSRRVRADAIRRRQRETRATGPTAESSSNVERRDLRQVLDEELDRLPEHYRAPLVLCYLEGRTLAEAADQLGCKDGTICSRLARGRDLLRSRLERRGVTPTVGLAGAALTEQSFLASVPSMLAESSARLAATGSTTPRRACRAQLLAEGMMKAMLLKKIQIVTTALLLVAGLVAAGTSLLARSESPGSTAPALPETISVPDPPDPPAHGGDPRHTLLDGQSIAPGLHETPLSQLQKERYNAALALATALHGDLLAGRANLEGLLAAVQSLYEAELDLKEKPAQRLALLERRVTTLRAIEMVYQARLEAGTSKNSELALVRLKRVEAEIQGLKARQQQ